MDGLINPADSLERQRDKLLNICTALMHKVEQSPSDQSNAYAHFERAALLDGQVRQRTADLERALDLLNESNAKLAEAKQDAEQSRAVLNEAIESVDEGFALFDSNDRLLLYNTRFCEDLSDIRRDLQVGMPFESFVDIVSNSSELHLPDGMTPKDWALSRLQRHREDSVVFNIALTHDRWMQVSEHRTGQGGTAILQTDISYVMREQHRERAELVDTQAKMLRATLDHLAQGVWIFDNQARLVGWNRELEHMIQAPARYLRIGTRFSSLFGVMKSKMMMIGPKSRMWLLSWSEQTSGRVPVEFEMRGTGGKILSVFAQEMPDQGFVMSFSDITEERATADKLRDLNKTLEQRVADRTQELNAALREAEAANQTKNRFVAAASHDLLQPLSAAKLYLTSLQDPGQVGQVAEISGKAEEALKGAEDIIEALLDISKLDAGHITFDIRPFSLRSTLQSLANELTPFAMDKGLDLKVRLSEATIVSDPVFFRRVLQNLISNAIKYTDQGRILVGARNGPDNTIRIEVHDTGAGIAAGDQARIFQEFTRLDDSHSGAKGIGLGLAIVERACAALGHNLGLRSVPGQGSCFSVGVARNRGALVWPDSAGRVGATDHKIAGRMLLLVENNADLANAITLRLESSGAHVVFAPNGEQALALLEEIELLPDAALLDYQLGSGMDGLDLYRALRTRYGRIPTFILSADRGAALKSGCEALDLPLMSKPIDFAALSQALDAVFRQTDGRAQAFV